MRRGIPNRPRSGKATRKVVVRLPGERMSPIALGGRSTDFATMDKPEWRISEGPVPYPEALAVMEERVADIRAGHARELVWLLEHPPLYTSGTSARPQALLQPMRFTVLAAGRSCQATYRGTRVPRW